MDKLKLTSGGSVKLYGFSPVQISQSDTTTTRIQSSVQIRQTEAVLFAETEYQLANKQQLTTGLRINTIGNQDKMFTNLEPRIGYHGIFAKDFAVSASIGRMTQPIHRVANPGLGIPFEMFLPSSAELLPETSWNFSLGAAKDYSWNKNKFSMKADAWYKSMKNIVDFQDGYDVLTSMLYKIGFSEGANSIVTQGNGRAYGIDISADWSRKYWSLTADYTLMQATNQFDELNDGRPFAASTDIRHSLSITGELKLSPSWIMSATWQYRSGKPITVPTHIFAYPTFNPVTGELDNTNPYFQVVETERNNYRTKAFHKLDISFTHNYKAFKKYNGSISLGIYNVYNRVNPYLYFITTEKKTDGNYMPILKSMSMFPILPSFTWSVKF
ncbi:MAG: TonB-dependent receptor [Paludibacter sp.]|nr:TonB-dependent receptor [Paludibacter sp.]